MYIFMLVTSTDE